MPPHGGTIRRMKKVVLWVLYTVNTGTRRGQHPERTYASKSKERTERRISGESCLSEASYEPPGAK